MDSRHQAREHEAPHDPVPAPWDEPAGSGPEPRPVRHDAFTPGRRRLFLGHLAKTGCIADAARLTGVAARTVYRHQDTDFDFARYIRLAIEMAGGGLEQIAWERAVTGVTEAFACGGKVHTRQRYSEGLLRLLLQGTNPKKYGPRPGFTKKRLRQWERKEIEREIHREQAARQPSIEQVMRTVAERAANIRRHRDAERLAAGWTMVEDGHLIPPGYIRDPASTLPECHATPRDSV